ncbi:MAG: hypothetical protein R6X19_11125 [Kiritimatiellia bacterium]
MKSHIANKLFHVEVRPPKQARETLDDDLQKFSDKHNKAPESGYPGAFIFGVAFNPYEPQDHVMEKMCRKIDAGAQFIITQPVLGKDERVLALAKLGLPVIVEAWMSKRLSLLSKRVASEISEGTRCDPMTNLREMVGQYPGCGFCRVLLGVKTQLPFVKDYWK